MELANKSEEEILSIANPIMDNLMEASTNIDYANHIKDFSDKIKNKFTEEEFQSQCKERQEKYGEFSSRKFMGITKQSDFINIYWKQKTTKNENEFAAILTLTEEGSRYIVQRAFVDLWHL